ncbi:MAG: IS5 family transposase, partial [Rhodospirillales bacterium]|nr:IS5 family transposase [Rhodospirillales bacterium]
MNRKGLMDEQWDKIKGLVPGKVTDCGVTAHDNRLFVDGVLWIARTGSPWRDLPSGFGKWNSVYIRFSRWAKKGVWENLFKALADDPDFEYLIIDSTIVRAHQHAAGAKGGPRNQSIGRSRGGLTSKIHIAVDALGNPLRFILTPGQWHDITQAEDLVEGLQGEHLLADKAYDSDEFRDHIDEAGMEAVIPPNRSRSRAIPYDKEVYKERHLVECFINKIKHFRRIATRYEKT